MAVDLYSDIHRKLLFLLGIGFGIIVYTVLKRSIHRRRFSREHGCRPVAGSLTKDPFLGLDIIPETIRAFMQNRMLEVTDENHRIHGKTFSAKVLFQDVVVTIEPENIKTILSLKFHDYSIGFRLEAFRPLLGAGIFDTDGEHWATSRALIRPSFTRDRVADLTSFEDLMQDLFALLPREDHTIVDLQDLFFRYTLDSATEFLFGRSVGSLKQTQSQDGFAEAFHYAQKSLMVRGMLGRLSFFYRDPKAARCYRICRDFAQRFVDEAINAVEVQKEDKECFRRDEVNNQKRVFSHEMAWQTSDKTRILDEMMNVLIAGRDTTASALSNLFFMLAKNPAIWDKLRREVADLQGQPPTYEQLRNLKYVHCCVNESLRLHPVVPLNERMAVRDTVLPLGGGEDGRSPVFVPKGAVAAYNVYAMHRRKDIYGPDAEEFRPERWLDDNLRPGWAYLPFNGGPRICIGQQYALTEVSYVVVRMAQEFTTLGSRDPGPWEELRTFTVCSRNGVKVCLTPA